jgi:hypothetical protein
MLSLVNRACLLVENYNVPVKAAIMTVARAVIEVIKGFKDLNENKGRKLKVEQYSFLVA